MRSGFVVVSFALIAFRLITATKEVPFAYSIVFDAGSSGTRVHVYDFVGTILSVPQIDVEKSQAQTKKVKPGLSHFALNSSPIEIENDVKLNIDKLLTYAKQFVPEHKWAETPVILKATAGLRAVALEPRHRVIHAVQSTLRGSGFLFKDEWASVIPGVEEGGLAWVTANYLSGALNSRDEIATTGVVEMGGGSTQISFALEDRMKFEKLSPKVQYHFEDLNGHPHNIYALSYIGFGQDYAQEALKLEVDATAIAAAEEGLDATTDPCYPIGYQRNVEAVTVEGTGQFENCRSILRRLLFNPDPRDLEDHHPAIVPGVQQTTINGGIMQPALEGSFIATENFFYIRNDILPEIAPLSAMDLSEDVVTKLGQQVCTEVMESSSKIEDPNKYCFAIAYQSVLLEQVGAVGEHTPTVTRTINGADVDWAVGAAVVNYIERNRASASGNKLLRYDQNTGLGQDKTQNFQSSSSFKLDLIGMLIVGLAVCAFLYVKPLRAKDDC